MLVTTAWLNEYTGVMRLFSHKCCQSEVITSAQRHLPVSHSAICKRVWAHEISADYSFLHGQHTKLSDAANKEGNSDIAMYIINGV